MAKAPLFTLASMKEAFPKDKMVTFSPGRGAPEVTAKITGYRESGTPGQRGYSVFLETVEERGGFKPAVRSVRPGTCTLVG